MAFPYTQTFGDGTPYPVVPLGTTAVPVANQTELDAKIATLAAGQKLVLGAGIYTSLTITGKNGTATAGISVVAQAVGGPRFNGGATIKDCSYLTVSGLTWPQDSAGDTFQFRGTSHHCRMIRCVIGPAAHPGSAITTEAGTYVYVGDDCHDLDIGYNELRNKARSGNGVRVYGNFSTFVGCKRVRIHHNDIHDFYPAAVNDFEPIRVGVSTMSRTDGYHVVERNVLTNIRSEPELISIKMGAVRTTGNVARLCSGSMVIRHGRNCTLADNYAVDGANTTNTLGEKSGGYRFYDSGHLVERNYGGGLTGTNFQDPLIIDSGDAEGTSTNLAAHWRVVGATVQGNVLVNCPVGVTIGHNYSLAPSAITVRNNVAIAVTSATAVTQRIAPVSSTVEDNLYYSSAAVGGFAQDSDGIYRKDGYGPRLTYLDRTEVGPSADLTEADGTGVILTGGGTGGGTVPPGIVQVGAGADVSTVGGGTVTLTATEANTSALTITARKWELVGVPGATPGAGDQTTAAGRLGWGAPLAQSDEFTYSGAVDTGKWSPMSGASAKGTWEPTRGTVNGSQLVATGLVGGQSFMAAHRFGQKYGRWECRMRTFQTGTTTGGGTGQTLGVGGVAVPPGAVIETQDRFAQNWTISSGGTASNPKVYEGGNHTVGRVTITAPYVVVQNYRINPQNQYAVYISDGAHHSVVQNCDIKGVRVSGDGDLNAFTVFASDCQIKYCTAINYVDGDPGDSHTDAIQTWVSSSHPNPCNNLKVIGNKFVGPHNTSRNSSTPSIHQIIMVESANASGSGNSGGSGTPTGWLIADNEFVDSWNQCVKTNLGNNFVFTRNKFLGSSDRIFALSGSGHVVYSDNTFGSGYGTIGHTVTSGNGPGTTPGGSVVGGNYNPLVAVWPDSNLAVEDGAYYVETGTPGEGLARAQMYFPRQPSASPGFREFTKTGVDWTQFHTVALEWTPTALAGYIDGVQFFTTGGGATTANRDIQTMPSGHLILGMENPSGTSMNPATMEVDWVRVYSLNPVGTVGGVTPGTISTSQSVAWTAPLTVGTYVLRYTVTLSDASTRSDDVNVTVAAAQPGWFFPAGIPSEEAFGGTTMFWTGTARPSQLLYPGPATFPGANTFPGLQAGTTTPPDALPGTFIPPGIPSEEEFGVSTAFSMGVPPLMFFPPGIPSEEEFGETTAFTVGSEPAPAVGGVFVPSLWAVDKLTGTMIPLPKWQKITISRVRHALGTITVDYPADAPGFSTLAASVQASPPKALEIRVWLGGNSTGSLGGWLVAKSASNRLVPGSVWTFSGHFHEWLLTKAVVDVQPKTTVNPNGEMVFAGATYGQVLLTAIQQAQARRALPLVVCDFTASRDSNGQPWLQLVTNLRLPPKTTIMQIADKGAELGLGEYYMTGARVLRAFNPGTRGVDRSVTSPPLVFQQTVNLAEHSVRESARDTGTAVLAAGAEGFYAWGTDLTAEASLGFRAEVGADGGNITSQSGVDAYASVQAQVVSKGVAEYTSGIGFRPGDPLPLLSYDVGDVAVAVVGTDRVPSRIEQLDLAFAPGEAPQGTVAQNSLVVDKLTALYRKLNALASGDAVVGTSTATPGGSGEDHNPPAAPTGVVVSSNIAYTAPGQTVALAQVTAGWLPVTTNAYIDGPTADKVAAANLIGPRLAAHLNGDTSQLVLEDWSYSGMPEVVALNHTALVTEYRATAGSTAPTLDAAARDWLLAYDVAHRGSGAATDDVAQYRVQFAYLQPVLVGGLRTGTFGVAELQWHEPLGSPTRTNSLTFANVEAGRAVGLRVAAVDTSGNQGPWSERVDFLSQEDTTPPPVASKPTASAWFRTMNITWDGKGAEGEDLIEAAPDVLSGGGVEIHVGQGFNFEPHRPFTPDGKLDLATSTTYKATLYGAGTWNVTDLTIGVTYYARLVAFDRNGNAADPSATSDGVKPEQLVTIDIGPNAIGRAQIIDGEIVRAKIADLAVNTAKVEEISAGVISAGTMTAQVAVGGRFYTLPQANGNRVEFDSAGIRLYRGNTIVGRWQVADASMLNTGTFQTGLSGRRITILPTGTMFFWPDAGVEPGFLENANGDLRMSGSVNTNNLAGYVTIDSTRAALTYGLSDFTPRTRFQTDPIAAATWAPIISARIDRRFGNVDGLGPRWLYTNFDNTGDIGTSIVHLQHVAAASNHAVMYGANSDAGIVFDAGYIAVVHNNISPAPIAAQAFNLSSGRASKMDIRPIGLPRGALGTVRAAESQEWSYVAENAPRRDRPGTKLRKFRMENGQPVKDESGELVFDVVDGEWTHPQAEPRRRFGPIAEDLPAELRHRNPRTGELMVSLGDMVGVLWAAVRDLADEVDGLRRGGPVRGGGEAE